MATIARRDFLKTVATGAAALLAAPAFSAASASAASARPRPNILWITCEDTSPWFGFCGVPYATTPNLDRLAAESVHYTRTFTTAPVCAPCRFGIVSGIYATSMGTPRLRSRFAVPDFVHGYPSYLRAAGYYCANNVKTDYNTAAEPRLIADSWNDCSARAHWRGRKPGQPFFTIFNLTQTHQSQVFPNAEPAIAPEQKHDPAQAPLPPYYPDTPTARATMARVHDCITAMDVRAGAILKELEADGLRDDTIVFFYPDHGQGIPRGKRTLWDSGLQVPLLVRFPEKYRGLAPGAPGSKCDRLVSSLDLGPSVLSLAGLPVPEQMQGKAFLGAAAAPPRRYVFGARDRVDEANDVSRSVRDGRYLYIRNYMPHISWNAPEDFSDQLPLRRELAELAAAGKLNEAQLTYAGPDKPAEALYDSEQDPWQVKNLADDPAHRETMERMRKALRAWQTECRDLGLIHEWQAAQMCAEGRSLYEVARDDIAYPLPRVLDTADLVGRPGKAEELARRLADPDPTVRYWAALGLRAAGAEAAGTASSLRKAFGDPAAPVRIEAAGALAAQDGDGEALNLLVKELAGNEHAALHAARTLQLLGEKARPVLPAMEQALAVLRKNVPDRPNNYAANSLEWVVARLGGKIAPAPATKRKQARKKGAAKKKN